MHKPVARPRLRTQPPAASTKSARKRPPPPRSPRLVTDQPQYPLWPGSVSEMDCPATLIVPWSAIYDPELVRGLPSLTPAFLLTVPLLLMVGALRLRSRVLLATATVYALLWVREFRDLRYLLPAIPIFALASAEALDRFA